jgi:hypothetical protein
MMALEGGEKVLTATVYKRRREVQQRWREPTGTEKGRHNDDREPVGMEKGRRSSGGEPTGRRP